MKLQYRITLLIFAILLVVGVAGAFVMLSFQRHNVDSQFEESALTVAKVLRYSLTEELMEVDRGHIQEAVTLAAERPLINEVVIFSNTQVVYASGEVPEIGQRRNDEELAQTLSTGEVVNRAEKQYGNNELCVILPVYNEPRCHTCHGSEASILGAIEVGFDRSQMDAQIWDQTLIMGLIAGVTFVAVGVALAFTFRSAVVKPLYKLTTSARRFAQGDFSARADVKTDDEVGTVARTFNEMAERVQQYADALEDSKRELEQRVQDRTTQLQQMAMVRGQLLERLISAQEEERRRIARELHDEAGQSLTMMMMDLARAIDALPKEAVEAKEKLSQSRSLAAQTLEDLRKLIYDLRPEVLDQLGLVPALRSYVKSRLEAENIKTKLHFAGLGDRLSPQIETTLFRIVQEAITNIIRHSGASNVSIEVKRTDSQVSATIVDNGKGFDVEAALKATESWGLRGIRERVAVVGGELSVESGDGQGTRIMFQIPLGSA